MLLFLHSLLALWLAFTPATKDQKQFFKALKAHHGKSYTGTVVTPLRDNDPFAGKELKIFFQKASSDSLRVPFWVGDDTSRTWLITIDKKTGLLLKHDHRHADGSPDSVTMYGGHAKPNGTALSQSFPADAFTAQLLPAAATNEWTLQLSSDKKVLSYILKRNGQLRFQADFKLQ
ncbi:hypothetical protein [Nibribacter koreensis]|uniref:Uncharacterized protein n=1 Tax=Nibribacter koreensis TaxID=1084519 RepID=A0ABP8FII5_9BACT